MQKKDRYFETKFEMAKIIYPATAKMLRRAENGTLFMGGIAVITAACALAGYMGYEQPSRVSPKLYGIAIGCSGLFCISNRKTANDIRQNLTALALEISDGDAYFVQYGNRSI